MHSDGDRDRVLVMKTLQQLATLSSDQIMNDLVTQAHTGKVLGYLDEGLSSEDAIKQADNEMFDFMVAGDIFAGQEQSEF